MLHHHINKLDIERLDDYSSIELEARLQDIVHRITHPLLFIGCVLISCSMGSGNRPKDKKLQRPT